MKSVSEVVRFYFECEARAKDTNLGKVFRPEDKDELSAMVYELVNDHSRPGLDVGVLARFVNHKDLNKNATSRRKHFSRINSLYYHARDTKFLKLNEAKVQTKEKDMQDTKVKEFLMAYEKAEIAAPVDSTGGKVFLLKDKIDLAEKAIGLKERGLVDCYGQVGTLITEYEISRGRCLDRKKSKAKHDMRIRTWTKDYIAGILRQDKASAVSKLHTYKDKDTAVVIRNFTESLDSVIFSALRQGVDESTVKTVVEGSVRECGIRYKKHTTATKLKEFLKDAGISLDMAKSVLLEG